MTPQQMAQLHQAAFSAERGWQADEFRQLLASEYVRFFGREGGFALVRTVAREAELLTLAVAPGSQRQGIANALMTEWMSQVRAESAFLEVASDNQAALSLYRKHGFAPVGRRMAYYRRPDGPAVDAVLMQASLH